MSAAGEYAELLKLIEVSGPFVSLPVFKDVFPQGFGKDSPDQTRELRELYDDWREARTHTPSLVSPAQREWLRAVFVTWLGWPVEWLVEDNAIPQNLAYFVAQHRETLRPNAALVEDGKPRLLLAFLAPNQQPDRRPPGATWNASHATRMAELLHATHVPLGLVTNGERFTLVYAEPDQPTGFADFRAELWFDERLTLRGFRDFLSADALFNRPPEQALDALYRRSLENQQEVSTTLGRQVRQAVEMFVAGLDRADREGGRLLLKGIPEEHIYEAALTLMMRLVFLFFAEERDLLPLTNPVYSQNYAVTTLHDQLGDAANRLGEEVLERRYDAFPRLLATFRAVHSGIDHDLAVLPAYGGDLFDPDRFSFLEGRAPGSAWQAGSAQPFPIHNRTVLHLLKALQFLEMKVPGGGRETRRVSFRALDIEQIGHVYEGLLDHTVRRASGIVLGLDGKEEPEIALSVLNHRREQPDFVEWLAGETGRSARAIENALTETSVDDPIRWPDWEHVAPYAGLVRRDDNGGPCVIPAGSLYVTTGAARRQTGTQYTPRSLTESVVNHALAPLVYIGPVQSKPMQEWQLKPAGQILDLKICDFACGSAAFLVAAARYLSAHLVEAWEVAQREHGENVQITPYGHASSGLLEEELIPTNLDERNLYALRIVVERCLYGVDRNPLAVEMAKLSLWLLTLQRDKPFTFLDHAVRCGDSLLGVDLKQLATWSLSGEGRQTVLFEDDLSFAADKREGLMKMQYHPRDQQRLLDAAITKTRRLRAAADRLIATAFEVNPEASAAAIAMGLEEQEAGAQKILDGKRPFHWPVEFPEVFLHGQGFDAIIGNPPYMGGRNITTNLGKQYNDTLQTLYASPGTSSDLCSYFIKRAFGLINDSGYSGLITVETIASGKTKENGLDHICLKGGTITRAHTNVQWPGNPNLKVAIIHFTRGPFPTIILNGLHVGGITSALSSAEGGPGTPRRLQANVFCCFQGITVNGEEFILSPERADAFIAMEPKSAEVLTPYLTGEDLNQLPVPAPSSLLVNFHEMPEEQARSYSAVYDYVRSSLRAKRTAITSRKDVSEKWWSIQRVAPEMTRAMRGLSQVLARTRYGNSNGLTFVTPRCLFSDGVLVYALSDHAHFAVLQSEIHYAWALEFGSPRAGGLRYKIKTCFETFPMPVRISDLEPFGRRYFECRQDLMNQRKQGLTATHNLLHRQNFHDSQLEELRRVLTEMDYAVAAAYEWKDLDLSHGFYETKQGTRYTISDAARRKVIERLLTLNYQRFAEEQAALPEQPRSKRGPRSKVPAHPELF